MAQRMITTRLGLGLAALGVPLRRAEEVLGRMGVRLREARWARGRGPPQLELGV